MAFKIFLTEADNPMITYSATKQIKTELAQIMANYGDEPIMLMQKLEQLINTWFNKGLNNKKENVSNE